MTKRHQQPNITGAAHRSFTSSKSLPAGFEQKFVPLREFKGLDEEGPGHLDGHVSIFGNLDDGGDIILEGAYAQDLIDRFLTLGFTAADHIWETDNGQIGYPMEARSDEIGLWVSHKFHSTDDAQRVRTKARERLQDGKVVGLSIGYKPGQPLYIYPKDYESLLPKYVKAQYLAEALEKAKSFPRVRVLPIIEDLAESSVVTRAMNKLAMAASVKSAGDGTADDEAGSQDTPEETDAPPLAQDLVDDLEAGEENPDDKGDQLDLFPGKIGARNNAGDIVRIQSIHDMATELHNAVCPAYDAGKGVQPVKISEQVKTFFANAYKNLKSMFSNALEESTAPTPWQIFYSLLDVRDQIADLQESAEGTNLSVDPGALLDEALAEFLPTLREALMRSLDQIANAPTYIYYGLPPAELKVLASLRGVESKTLEQHSLAVVSAVQEYAQTGASIEEAVSAYVERANAKQEFRIDDGRAISETIRNRKAEMDQALQAAREKILAAVEKGEGLKLLAPADLTAQLAKLRLQTARLQTNALASHN